MAQSEQPTELNWERKTIEKLALSALQEQKRTRYWSTFFKVLTFIYLFTLLFIAMDWDIIQFQKSILN
jgi:protease-4